MQFSAYYVRYMLSEIFTGGSNIFGGGGKNFTFRFFVSKKLKKKEENEAFDKHFTNIMITTKICHQTSK